VGLEAALAAAEAGLPFVIYEAGATVAASVRHWGHVRLFTPWPLNVSPRARRVLEAAGLQVPDGTECPTGQELVDRVLEPIAQLPEIAPCLRLGVRVAAIGREGLLKHQEIGSEARRARPFRLLLRDATGREWVENAGAVLDCSGTYAEPNSLGDGGVPAPGERALKARIARSIPNLAKNPEEWANRRILLVGAGHSAQTAARGLARLAQDHPETQIIWALRRENPVFGIVEDDPLRERSTLGAAAQRLAEGASPDLEARFGVVVEKLALEDEKIEVSLRRKDSPGAQGRQAETLESLSVDRVLALTGSVGDHEMYRQLQVHECYATSGPMKLAATLLGEGGGDCLTQSSHGADVLKNPEPDFFILGSKSYGRNNTFLLRVGWEQINEVLELFRS